MIPAPAEAEKNTRNVVEDNDNKYYKNYKELCRVLGEPVKKSTNSNNAQSKIDKDTLHLSEIDIALRY